MSKTTTLIFHHARCNPMRWTVADLIDLADYLRAGEPQYAVALDRMGIEVTSSDHRIECPVTDEEVEHATLRSIGLDPNDYESSQSYTLRERQKEMMRVALQAFADGRV